MHDIEYGYGDPLRVKVSPEFSLRLQDADYAPQNATISRIQGVMLQYFQACLQPPGSSDVLTLPSCQDAEMECGCAVIYSLVVSDAIRETQARTGKFAREGIAALEQSMAAIYYLPFQCAVSLYFRFSGQSIPNRCKAYLEEQY